MRQFILLSVAMVSVGCPSREAREAVDNNANPRREAVRQARVFAGGAGLDVVVVDLVGGKALVKVTGSESPVEGLVIEHVVSTTAARTTYQTQYQGRTYNTILIERRYGRTTVKVYLPGPVSGQRLTMDEAKTKAVDVAALLKLHRQQTASGALSKLRRFDAEGSKKQQQKAFEKDVASLHRSCGHAPRGVIEWAGVDEAALQKYSVSGHCANVVSAMRYLCRHDPAKKLFRPLSVIRCRVRDQLSLELQAKEIVYSVDLKTPNLYQRALEVLRKLPAGGNQKLSDAITITETDLCKAKGTKRYVIVAPSGAEHPGISYGDGVRFVHNNLHSSVGPTWFFDPRQYNPRHNSSFRGIDLRSFSYVKPDRKAGKCLLTCGTRKVPLELVAQGEKEKILAAAKYDPPPHQREAYALARDRKGIYYYVDRGTTKQTRKDFRVYIGPRGRMKSQKMKDIVSDSEGDIFSTRAGKLRLVLGKERALWIARRQKKLLWVPVRTNLKMIYNELGVYLGQRLGVPCDDL